MRHHRGRRRGTISRALSGLALIATAAACSAEDLLRAPADLPAQSPATALVPLDPFGVGETGPGIKGCTAEGYRQFDFWVGQWDVFGFAPTRAGTSVIESELGGCAIEENWTDAGGNRGKSLNTYDASKGTWSQFWVSEGGCPFGATFMEGTFADGSMTLQGTREQPLGFLIGPPCGPPPNVVVHKRTDAYRWTLLPDGTVLQQPNAAIDDAPLPPFPPPSSLVGFRYHPVAEVTPIPPSTRGSFCPNRAGAKQLDFLVGSWDVHQGNGTGAQGTATFTKTMTGCLVEEQFAGPDGYAGMSYNTFDVFTQRWVRTYVDTDGQRIHMFGGLTDGAMVFTGTKHGSAGRAIEVKMTYAPVTPTEVEQRWEYSKDGGATWQAGKTIRYTKR